MTNPWPRDLTAIGRVLVKRALVVAMSRSREVPVQPSFMQTFDVMECFLCVNLAEQAR